MSAETDVVKEKAGSGLGIRHLVILTMFLGTTVGYATRVSLSVAIVAMTSEDSNEHGFPTFDWDKTIKDTILSSFFWGYIVLQIPAGLLTSKFGGKMLCFVAVFVNGLANFFVPLAAIKGGWIAVCACRVVMGLSQGLLYPSLHGLLGQWSPASERSRMGTFVYAGGQFGTIIEMMLAGVLSASKWGWPSIYYVVGVACIVWSILWLIVGASTPSDHRWISKEEVNYIKMNSGSQSADERKNISTPWKKIWTSLPFWSILLAHSGQNLGFWTLLTEMPTYMKSVLGIDIKNSGILSALPYMAMFILSILFSWIADFLVNKNIITLTTSRKIFNTLAFWGAATTLLILAYLPQGHVIWAVVLLTTTVGINGAHNIGFLISHIDLSPNHASTLMGITNGFGNILSIVAPLSVSVLVKDEHSATEWRKVFILSVVVYLLTNMFYLLFMSGKIQEWNNPKKNSSIENGEKIKESTNEKKVSVIGEPHI